MALSDNLNALSEPVNKLLVPLATSAGTTLQDAWELVFGGFGTYVQKKRLVRQKSLESFKKTLEDSVASIPEDRLCEPPLSIVGPALEASKYHFEEPVVREMFAKLIASSMDRERIKSCHPAFVDIIRQMSPLDAHNLRLFFINGNGQMIPVAQYRKANNDDTYRLVFTNVFISNPDELDLSLQATSISSLVRLGLLEVDYDIHLTEKMLPFGKTPEYLHLVEESKNSGNEWVANIQEGIALVTPLGNAFARVCLLNPDD